MVGVGPTGLPYCRPPLATGEVERRRTEEVRCTALLYTQPHTHSRNTPTNSLGQTRNKIDDGPPDRCRPLTDVEVYCVFHS